MKVEKEREVRAYGGNQVEGWIKNKSEEKEIGKKNWKQNEARGVMEGGRKPRNSRNGRNENEESHGSQERRPRKEAKEGKERRKSVKEGRKKEGK